MCVSHICVLFDHTYLYVGKYGVHTCAVPLPSSFIASSLGLMLWVNKI